MKLVIDEKEYQIKPLTIDDYLFFTKKENQDIKDLELLLRFTDAPKSELVKLPFHKINFVASVIRSDFGGDDDYGNLDLVITHKGKKYGLIKPSEISYEEWVNLEVFMGQQPLNIRLLATHLYKPLKSDKVGDDRELIDYDLNECESRVYDFGGIPMGQFTSALFFLITFAQKLTESLAGSMANKLKMKEQMNELKKQQKKKFYNQ
jgi:hypothetical protein